MKKVYTILILITIISCSSQNKTKQNKTMKTFDIEKFNKNKNELGKYTYKVGNTTINQRENLDSYIETIKKQNSLLETYNVYYKKGTLKLTLKAFPNDFITGSLKEYNEQGNLIKEENLDKPFTYSWEDVKKYLTKHNVEDIQKQVIDISRWSDSEETTWTLEFNGKYNEIKGRFVITLDGKTGEELEVKLFKGKKALDGGGTGSNYEIIHKKK